MSVSFLSLPTVDGIPGKRARFLFRVRSVKAKSEDEQLAATQSHGVLSQRRYMEITGNKVVLALAGTDNFNHVEKDDFIISLRTFEGGIERASETGCISPAYTVLAPSPEVEPQFYQYLLKSQVFIQHLRTTVTGIRDGKSVKFENFANIVLPLPDLPTQRAIADFLDRETARIDCLIEKKQRLVELLGERKTNELERLLFESGFEIRKLRREARTISKGTTPSTIGAEMVDDGVRFLKAENVTWTGVSTSPENFVSDETHKDLKRSALKADDVLVVIAGALGKTAVMPSELTPANTNQAVSFVRLREPRYAAIVCAAIGCPRVQRDILLTSVQSAQPNLSMEDLGNLMLPFPNEEEISKVMEQVTAIINQSANLTVATEISVDRLKEYRSALITSAVTGQIDVSTYARSGTTDRQLDAFQSEMS